MATPMTSVQVVIQLKKWGIKYVEIPGWATHNRNSVGAWGGINGFIWHHTGADITNGNAKSYASGMLYSGRSDLPGPLCHFSIGIDGTVYLVGWGRANHAGGGDPAVLQHVINEDYTGQLKPTRGDSNGVDGNAHFYGVEIQYSGSHLMAAAQYAAARRLSAAILDFHGWSEKSVIAHGEWSSDKWDPGYAPSKTMAMPTVRADVKATLTAGPTQEDGVALTAADVKTFWLTDGVVKNPNAATAKDNPFIAPATGLNNIEIITRRTEAKLDALAKTNAALVDTVAKLAAGLGDLDPAAIVTELKAAIESIDIHLDVPDA